MMRFVVINLSFGCIVSFFLFLNLKEKHLKGSQYQSLAGTVDVCFSAVFTCALVLNNVNHVSYSPFESSFFLQCVNNVCTFVMTVCYSQDKYCIYSSHALKNCPLINFTNELMHLTCDFDSHTSMKTLL